MPESRGRKSADEKRKLKSQRESKPKKVKAPSSRRWVPPTFIAVGLLGVADRDEGGGDPAQLDGALTFFGFDSR